MVWGIPLAQENSRLPGLVRAYKTSYQATSLDRGFSCSRTRKLQVSRVGRGLGSSRWGGGGGSAEAESLGPESMRGVAGME